MSDDDATADAEARRSAFRAAASGLLSAPAAAPLALILIELDDADEALERDCLARLAAAAPGGAVTARLRAGVLSVLTPTTDAGRDAEALQAAARRFLAGLGRPARAGATWRRGAHADVDALLGDADAALREARLSGRDALVFDDAAAAAVADRRGLSDAIAAAIDDGAFEQVYQAQRATRSRGGDGPERALYGFEALTRWRRNGRPVAPDTFVPLAEATGQIEAIDLWGLRVATAQLGRWRAAGAGELTMSVNISPGLLTSGVLADQVQAAIAAAGVPPRRLTIEITERTPLALGAAETRETLWALRELGVGLAIDDFGVGYANYAALAETPATALKIDQSFAALLDQGPRGAALYRGFVALASAFGMTLVAEGVETPSQCDALAALGCEWAQGHFFGGPLSAAAAADVARAARSDGTGRQGP